MTVAAIIGAGAIRVIQPEVPHYRLDLFDRLAAGWGGRFSVHASPGSLGLLTERAAPPLWLHALGGTRRLAPGLDWQAGALKVRAGRGDVLVLCGAPRSLSTLAAMTRARARGARVIWWGHYLSPGSPRWRRALRTRLMGAADAVLFYTERELDAWRATPAGARDTRPLGALNNGLDRARIDPLRRPYRAEGRDNAALFVGRLTRKAGLDVALAALAVGGDTHLHVIGDGAEGAALRALAARLGVGARVAWHGGMTDEARIAAIANTCRVFLYPGDVGLSLIHGLAYGLPALVHGDTAHHMPEIAALAPGINGRTFARGDARALAAALDAMTRDASALDRLSRGALNTVRAEFNTERMAARFAALVAALAEREARR